jgi:hypothetical protein
MGYFPVDDRSNHNQNRMSYLEIEHEGKFIYQPIEGVVFLRLGG